MKTSEVQMKLDGKFIELETEQEYVEYRNKLTAYSDALRAYCRDNGTNGIPVEITKTFPFADEITNEIRSAVEVWEFRHQAYNEYFVYINKKEWTAITWTGQKLGTVSFGREYRTNFGDKRVPITVYGIDGNVYWGTYYKSAGDYARITKKKNQ